MAQITWQNVTQGQSFGDAGQLFRDAAANITKGIKGVGEAVEGIRTNVLQERDKRTEDAISSLRSSLQTPDALAQAQQELSVPGALEQRFGNDNQVNLSKIRDALTQQEGYVRDKFVKDFQFLKTKAEQQDFNKLEKIENDLARLKTAKDIQNYDVTSQGLTDITPALALRKSFLEGFKTNEERNLRVQQLRQGIDKNAEDAALKRAIDPVVSEALKAFKETRDKGTFDLSTVTGFDKLTGTQKLAAQQRFNTSASTLDQTEDVKAQAKQRDIALTNTVIKTAIISAGLSSQTGDNATSDQLLDMRKSIIDLVAKQTDGLNLSDAQYKQMINDAFVSSGITDERILDEVVLTSDSSSPIAWIGEAIRSGISKESIIKYKKDKAEVDSDPGTEKRNQAIFESELRIQEALRKNQDKYEIELNDPSKAAEVFKNIFKDTDWAQADALDEAVTTFTAYRSKYKDFFTNIELVDIIMQGRENWRDQQGQGDDFDPNVSSLALEDALNEKKLTAASTELRQRISAEAAKLNLINAKEREAQTQKDTGTPNTLKRNFR